jgi:putative transposase
MVLVKTRSLLKRIAKPWQQFLAVDVLGSEIEVFRKHERTGRPLGENAFVQKMELLLGRKLKPKKPGPKNKDK